MDKVSKYKSFLQMKEKVAVVVLVTFFSFNISAQQEFHYNFDTGSKQGGSGYTGVQVAFNGSFSLPTGALYKIVTGGIGANLQLKYMVDSKFAIGAYGGYNLLSGSSAPTGVTNSILQFGGLAEYYLLKGSSSPYLGLDIGNYIFSQSYSATASGTGAANTASRSSFGIGPNLGFVYNLNPNMLLNGNLKYNHTFEPLIGNYGVPSQFIQITIGLIFNLSYRPLPSDEE